MRAPLAALVLLLGVGGLLAAWHVSATRALEAEKRLQAQMATRVTLENRRTASDRLARRLEALRVSESQRPYFHYQNLYHDPKGASQGLSVVPSPLANGPGNPLVTAHFQNDANGDVTLPTLNEDLVELNAPDASDQYAVRDMLAASEQTIRAAIAPVLAGLEREAREKRAAAARIAQLESRVQLESKVEESRVQFVDPMAFAQNANSNVIYQQVKENTTQPIAKPAAPVEIRTTDFAWHTLDVGGKPALVALRAVHTPDGSLVQGLLTPIAEERTSWRDRETRGGWLIDRRHRLARAASASRGSVDERGRERFTRTFTAVAFVLLLVVAGVIWTLTRRASRHRSRAFRRDRRTRAAHAARVAARLQRSDRGEADAEKRERYAREIAGQTERLGRVVANVLEVTRLERGTFALAPRPGEIGAPRWRSASLD
jgi:hypothetical protein